MADSSFDLVSDFDQQELVNALDQVRREVATRYDFKGAHVTWSSTKTEIVLQADDEYRATAVKDLIQSKAVRRNLSLKIFDWGKLEPAGGGTVRQHIGLKRGLDQRPGQGAQQARARAVPEGEAGHPGRRGARLGQEQDELQAVIGHLRGLDYPVALQFVNYR